MISRDKYIENELRHYQQEWERNSLAALPELIFFCKELCIPLPVWAVDPIMRCVWFTWANEKIGRGRLGNHPKSVQEKRKHWMRYEAAKLCHAGTKPPKGRPVSWADAYKLASKMLRGGMAQGSPLTIERSHQRVLKAIKAGDGAKFGVAGENAPAPKTPTEIRRIKVDRNFAT